MQFLEAQGTQSLYSEREIPIDLLIEIFFRVPAKTIGRLHCLSKSWRSILNRPYFTDLFLTKSSTRPSLLLFSFKFEKNIYFFSSPHPENPDENTCLVPIRYPLQQKHSPNDFILELGSPLCGFFCRQVMGEVDRMVICNPLTGESTSLPKVELKGSNILISPYLGYDPIDKQLKVLCINFNFYPNTCDEHQVLTLENGNRLWRTTQCKPHYPKSKGICIDGMLYYTAGLDRYWKGVSMIVCFDVRSEKFSFIDIDEWMTRCTLINYKGQLGALQFTFAFPKSLEFWVLEDAERCVWSKKIYTLAPLLDNVVKHMDLLIVGMTSRGEVLFSTPCLEDPFYIYYFNLESNRVTRVQFQDLEVFKNTRIFTSLDYEENLKLM